MRLDIEEDSRTSCFVIGWWDKAMGIEGDLCLGELLTFREDDSDEQKRETEEHNFVTNEVRKVCPPDFTGTRGFYWETMGAAGKALRVAKAAVKQFQSERPWPDWAKQAVAAGWKPPRGWKP